MSPALTRNTLIVLFCWAAMLTVLSLSGFFIDFSHLPPRIGFAVLVPLPIVVIVAFSRTGTEWLRRVPPQRLVYRQAFRILVEIMLWVNFMRGLIPVQMSFEGRNFDVLSGLLAIPVGYFCFVRKSWPRWIVVVYNIVGLTLLLNIIVISVLSMPTPLRYFHNEPANTLLGHFPYIFLPGLLVPLAYSLHILSLRQYFLRVPLLNK
jgi:ABC-type transport system involved in cytochrome bd biosynthesis fused ATPase/permease subunit